MSPPPSGIFPTSSLASARQPKLLAAIDAISDRCSRYPIGADRSPHPAGTPCGSGSPSETPHRKLYSPTAQGIENSDGTTSGNAVARQNRAFSLAIDLDDFLAGPQPEWVEQPRQRQHQILTRGQHLTDARIRSIQVHCEPIRRTQQRRLIEHHVRVASSPQDRPQCLRAAFRREMRRSQKGFHAPPTFQANWRSIQCARGGRPRLEHRPGSGCPEPVSTAEKSINDILERPPSVPASILARARSFHAHIVGNELQQRVRGRMKTAAMARPAAAEAVPSEPSGRGSSPPSQSPPRSRCHFTRIQ